MTEADLQHMKSIPGLHKVQMNGGRPGTYLLVASVGGELYGIVPDNKLADDGWSPDAAWGGCLLSGGIATQAQIASGSWEVPLKEKA